MTPPYTDDPVLVERVARALYERDRRGYFFGLFTDVEWDASRRKDRYRAEAHALLVPSTLEEECPRSD